MASIQLSLERLQAGKTELEFDAVLRVLTRSPGVGPGQGEESEAAVSGTLVVDNMDQKVVISGSFNVTRTMFCHRCAEAVEAAYVARVEITVLCGGVRGRTRDFDGSEDDDGWTIRQQRGTVELDDAIREAVVLDEPIHVVCAEPTGECDRRRNDLTRANSSGEDDIDPRWAALKNLRERDE